jgi:hypothetical protein
MDRIYGMFAEWLYDQDRTPADILSNVRSLVYIASVDGLAKYEAMMQPESKDEPESVVSNRRNEVLEFARSNPDHHRAVTKIVRDMLGAEALADVMGEDSFEWYNETEAVRGD